MKKIMLAILLSAIIWNSYSVEKKLKIDKGMNVVGMVSTPSNTPIEGVTVSDGYSVVKTNKNGVYQIKRTPGARFVFYTTPANYKVNVQDGMPHFYAPIDSSQKQFRADFILEKLPTPEKEFILLALGDMQPKSKANLTRMQKESITDLAQFKKEQSRPVYAFTLGDMCWDAPHLYTAFKESIAQSGITTFPVIGNHDHDQKITQNDIDAAGRYEATFGPTYYSVDRGDFHFIVLDNIVYNGRSTYTTHITSRQLNWLKKDLVNVATDKTIVLNMHSPTLRRNGKYRVANAPELYDIIKDYKNYIFAGHTHILQQEIPMPNIEEHTQGAICGALWYGDICSDGTPAGYKVYEIDGNKFKNSYYKSTGKPNNFQIKLYPPGTSPDHPLAVVANIWNWGNGWKVRCIEDGVEKSGVTSFYGYDCDAYAQMFGPEIPKGREKLEPQKTTHLFYYIPTQNGKKITIEATDPHGNSYQESIAID